MMPDAAYLHGLNAGEVHLWMCRRDQKLDSAGRYLCMLLMNREEQAHHQRLRSLAVRQQNMMTRAMVRTVLSYYHPRVRPSQWRFSADVNGKPKVAWPEIGQDVVFNISHGGGWISVALAARSLFAGRPSLTSNTLGVDVEGLSPLRDMAQISADHFSRAEQDYIRGQSSAEWRCRAFYEIWVLKEAYIKALGTGLSTPLQDFSIAHSGSCGLEFSRRRRDDPDLRPDRTIRLMLAAPDPDHRLGIALVSVRPELAVSLRQFDCAPWGAARETEPNCQRFSGSISPILQPAARLVGF